MKHVGKMKNNGAKVCIVYRTLPGDPHSALVVGTNGLGDTYHDALMAVVQDASGQQANELADILAVRKFPDGSNMLETLHTRGHLKKVPTNGVLVTPTPNTGFPLDEINENIAKQRGVSLEDLAISDGTQPVKAKAKSEPELFVDGHGDVREVVSEDNMSPAQLRSKADSLFKQAQQLRKKADELDPPKSKKKAVVEAE